MQKLDKSKLTLSLSKREKLVPYLEKTFETFDKPWEFKYEEKKGDLAFHPSGDCTPTATELYEQAVAAIAGEPRGWRITSSLRKSFQVGHFWHQLLQYIVLEELGLCDEYAIERRGRKEWGEKEHLGYFQGSGDGIYLSKPFHWAAGSGDIAPLVLPSGWEGVVDFKTINSATFAQSALPFADKYECQINIYMDFFNLDKALILGIQKDSPHAFKEWEFEKNDELVDVVYKKWAYVSDCLDCGAAPEQTYDEVLEEEVDVVQFELPLKGAVA